MSLCPLLSFPLYLIQVLIIRPCTPGHFCSIGFIASPAHGEIHPMLQKLVVLMLNIDYDIILYTCMDGYHDNYHKCHSWLNQVLLIIIYMVPQVQNRRSRNTQAVLVSDPKLYCRKQTADWQQYRSQPVKVLKQSKYCRCTCRN